MSDLEKYIERRKARDKLFAEDYEDGWHDFKIGVIIREDIGMQQVALKEAETRLDELIGMAADGEEIVITKQKGRNQL
jgi:hypothetical protein